MQIIIVQTEIEEAIRNHILNQITVKDNQRIDIDLRATRGSDGFQAVIDIVADGAPVRAQPAVEPEAPVVTPVKPVTAAKAAPAKVTKAAAPKAITPTPVAEIEAAVEDNADDVLPDEPEADAQLEDGDQSVAEIAAETDAEAPPKKTSLFANMKKPDNA